MFSISEYLTGNMFSSSQETPTAMVADSKEVTTALAAQDKLADKLAAMTATAPAETQIRTAAQAAPEM
jgi:hypothetical protein